MTGAGCALDAAARGLTVALLEQSDLAAGTSSRSSKLIHGGLRYLEQWRFALVREALRERSLITSTLAPHLVHPVPFVYLLEGGRGRVASWLRRLYVGAGVSAYDLLARLGRRRGASLPWHRHLSRAAVQRLSPGLDPGAHRGGVLYWDAQTDDARHTLALARTAAAHGAHVLTSMRVVGISRADDDAQPGTGWSDVDVVDRESGRRLRVRARVVVNATGVWSDDIEALGAGGDGAGAGDAGTATVRVSKGVHLVIPRDRIALGSGVVLATAGSVLFVIPWPPRAGALAGPTATAGHWIVGTTDTDWRLDRTHPAASRSDIEYLLEQLNRVLASPLTVDDVVGVYAGLRPLLADGNSSASRVSREHSVTEPTPGLISVKGGKYTTYRVMAADAVDAAVASAGLRVPASSTAKLPLVGAAGPAGADVPAGVAARLAAHLVAHLAARHGDQAAAVLDLVAADPSLAEPLVPGCAYLRAEVVHAVRAEAALHLDDVLTRRTRLSVETSDRAVSAAPAAAALMAAELGWSAEHEHDEVRGYAERVAAERDSQMRDTDLAADAARRAAADARQ
ncbi:MAG TPA: glycerol-3-phosphate dehydrogenase [Acidimicrobiaceae bacterium]|nr:glycerol-3-phosphate dehydrogenase [Acidimicrobiaceae bacterium]